MSDTTIRMDRDDVPPSPGGGFDHGRFVPGALVGSRYRIVAMLGKGGMGEVYRADDLLLGQPVALKFVPKRVAGDQQRLARLLAEVRIARQISHPNVCRVYDVGEVAGEHFISMEYVKGEDLGTLLHRIGRLAPDKGVQIARQMCAGLAAAHDRGVLHRDLKPANVMIDERGVARIMDFGLAALEDSAQANVREGTPAYMSPEQLDGADVTARSDIYALGLVLYEIFTGRTLFDAKTLHELVELRRTTSAETLRLSNDIDPAIERVIQRCLAPHPAQRPQSATAVAAALPGGDPLAAALAAGETPSPELVAAAGERFGIEPRTVLLLLGATIVSFALALFGKTQLDLASLANVSEPPDAMAARAREMLVRLGYTAKPADRAWGYRADNGYIGRSQSKEGSAVEFRYRDSPEPFRSTSFFRDESYASWPGEINEENPPLAVAGMTMLHLDPGGNLRRLEVVPPVDATPSATPYDWRPLLDAAGLGAATPARVAPQRIVRPFDQRAAWTWRTPAGTWRAEAAALGGKPVYFEVIPPWGAIEATSVHPLRTAYVFLSLVLIVLIAIAVLARRNLRLGRGDVRGAMRLAGFCGPMAFLAWIVGAHHVAATWEGLLGLEALAWASLYAMLMAFGYLALEPTLRRRRPEALVSWTRLLGGEVRDPLVGRDVLIGVLAGCFVAAAFDAVTLLQAKLLHRPPPVAIGSSFGLPALNGTNVLLADFFSIPTRAIFDVVLPLMLLLLLRIVVRKDLIAVLIVGALFIFSVPRDTAIPFAVEFGVILFVLIRYGFLAAAMLNVVEAMLLIAPSIWPPQQWHTSLTVVAGIVIALLAGYGFMTALAGRRLFTGDLIEA